MFCCHILFSFGMLKFCFGWNVWNLPNTDGIFIFPYIQNLYIYIQQQNPTACGSKTWQWIVHIAMHHSACDPPIIESTEHQETI